MLALSYKGTVNRLMNFAGEQGTHETNFVVQHDMTAAGGASGSPIFNRDGKVVAIHNSGIEMVQGKIRLVTVSSRGAMRIDLLNELLAP